MQISNLEVVKDSFVIKVMKSIHLGSNLIFLELFVPLDGGQRHKNSTMLKDELRQLIMDGRSHLALTKLSLNKCFVLIFLDYEL